ncbi:Sua5/YciO/YrdC/YwlC family protein, variant [Capsaspora owczarzaki ATCC 30864]|uniref:Threonylcarbamoyl-AMP synthase n=1 Tax=Capsaspora owczarzaki (strain ATCC 30864) TaxID=595528 RepID=A0A0D2WT10_CAPO3|nr:Sua5/YciO/YrdC/YwlC family protein, variant [Capsaspora owczarzaki ATCC 30864]
MTALPLHIAIGSSNKKRCTDARHPFVVFCLIADRSEMLQTVYGLAANAFSDDAVAKIFRAKNRPADNPLIVHVADESQLREVVEGEISQREQQLIAAFWPGPLTLILPRKISVSRLVTAGLTTVGVRMPSHPVAKAIIARCGKPLAAPSANISGRPSPTCGAHVIGDMMGKVAGIVDGGATGVGVESTVIDCSPEIPIILRPGGITKEEIETIIGPVTYAQELHSNERPESAKDVSALSGHVPRAPGMKYAHYAPKAPVTVVEGSPQFLQSLVDAHHQQHPTSKIGVLATDESRGQYRADVVVTCGARSDVASIARSLYDALRQFDIATPSVDCIYSESFSTDGLGAAVMNRLLKAASHQVVREHHQ